MKCDRVPRPALPFIQICRLYALGSSAPSDKQSSSPQCLMMLLRLLHSQPRNCVVLRKRGQILVFIFAILVFDPFSIQLGVF